MRFDRLDPAPFALDIGTTEKLVVNMNGGDDQFSATGNLAAAFIQITVDGGAATTPSSAATASICSWAARATTSSTASNDSAFMGAGDDVFQWDPGDGSDLVEGGDGTDTMLFNGSGGAEMFEASANGSRVLFTRNLGTIVMDLNDVESTDLNALGNTDQVIVNDLSGTDLVELNVNLAGTIGGSAGDGAADTVIVNATNGDDIIDVFGAGSLVSVLGLATQVNIATRRGERQPGDPRPGRRRRHHSDHAALGGDQTHPGRRGRRHPPRRQGADMLLGGDDNDFVFGDNGNDVAQLGAGDDVFQWNPATAATPSKAGRLRHDAVLRRQHRREHHHHGERRTRELLPQHRHRHDGPGRRRSDRVPRQGIDNIVIGDLSGTDVTDIGLDLRGPNGGGDGATDLGHGDRHQR